MELKKDSLFIAFISLLILNMLIIFLGVYSYFFGITDYTIISGIIAFVGAIMGGSITLVGVNKTIQRDIRKEYYEKLEQRANLKHVVSIRLSELRNFLNEAKKEVPSDNINDEDILFILNKIKDTCDGLISDGIHIGENNIDLLKDLTNALDALYGFYYDFNEVHEDDSYYEEVTHIFEQYAYDIGPKEDIFNLLEGALDKCHLKSKQEKEKLFKEVFARTLR